VREVRGPGSGAQGNPIKELVVPCTRTSALFLHCIRVPVTDMLFAAFITSSACPLPATERIYRFGGQRGERGECPGALRHSPSARNFRESIRRVARVACPRDNGARSSHCSHAKTVTMSTHNCTYPPLDAKTRALFTRILCAHELYVRLFVFASSKFCCI